MIFDNIAGAYKPEYPLFKRGDLAEENNRDDIIESLKFNLWYYLSDVDRKKLMVDRAVLLREGIGSIISCVKEKEPEAEIRHISVGGSYPWAEKDKKVNDIDFDVVVKGSRFAYYDVYDCEKIGAYATNPLKKISFTVLGEDNLFKGVQTADQTVWDDYVNTDVTIREGLIMPYRNVVLYGYKLQPKTGNDPAMLTRIDRQLFQADLLLQDKIGNNKYSTEEKIFKAHNRVVEAGILLLGCFRESWNDLALFYNKADKNYPLNALSAHELLSEVKEMRNQTRDRILGLL